MGINFGGWCGMAPGTPGEFSQARTEGMYQFENEREQLYVERNRFGEEGTPEEGAAVRYARNRKIVLGGILAQADRAGD